MAARSEKAKQEASPSREDIEKEFGKECVATLADGSWEARIRDPDKFSRAAAMLDGVRKHEAERGERVAATSERVTLVNRETGRVSRIPPHLAEYVARKQGMVERPRWGRGTRYRVGPGGKMQRYDRNIGWVED